MRELSVTKQTNTFLGYTESRICFSLWPGNNLNQNGGPVKQPPGCFTGELCVQAAQNRNGIQNPTILQPLLLLGCKAELHTHTHG